MSSTLAEAGGCGAVALARQPEVAGVIPNELRQLQTDLSGVIDLSVLEIAT